MKLERPDADEVRAEEARTDVREWLAVILLLACWLAEASLG